MGRWRIEGEKYQPASSLQIAYLAATCQMPQAFAYLGPDHREHSGAQDAHYVGGPSPDSTSGGSSTGSARRESRENRAVQPDGPAGKTIHKPIIEPGEMDGRSTRMLARGRESASLPRGWKGFARRDSERACSAPICRVFLRRFAVLARWWTA